MSLDNRLWEICLEIYKEMYKEAEPKADIDELIKTKVTKKEDWFLDYYLSEERQIEIIERIMKEHKCRAWERKKIRFEVYLGGSPSCVKKKQSSS